MMTMRIPTMVKTSSLFGFAFALVERSGGGIGPGAQLSRVFEWLEADRRLNLALLAHVYPDRRLGSER